MVERAALGPTGTGSLRTQRCSKQHSLERTLSVRAASVGEYFVKLLQVRPCSIANLSRHRGAKQRRDTAFWFRWQMLIALQCYPDTELRGEAGSVKASSSFSDSAQIRLQHARRIQTRLPLLQSGSACAASHTVLVLCSREACNAAYQEDQWRGAAAGQQIAQQSRAAARSTGRRHHRGGESPCASLSAWLHISPVHTLFGSNKPSH
jgi:hypothetical protein